MKLKGFVFLSIFSMVAATALLAASHTVSGVISYSASGPTGSWTAENRTISGSLQINPASGSVCINMNDWDSKNTRRDNHAKDMFEVDKYKDACFYPDSVSGNSIKGSLEIHGVKKPATFTGNIQTGPGGFHLQVETVVLVDDFGMTRPTLMGMKTKNEVTVKVDVKGGSL